MANIFKRLIEGWGSASVRAFHDSEPTNPINEAFFQFLGGRSANYDHNAKTYLEKGYGQNPDVFAIISQQADKTKAVPYYVKKVNDKVAKARLDKLSIATKGNYSTEQLARKKLLEVKAFESEEKPFPLEQPNPNQTWSEIFALYKVFLKVTGNAYFYMLSPEEGANKGRPIQLHILPSHLVKIVVKKNVDLLHDENPVSHYMLIEGNQYIEFDADKVIHIKYPNPFYDFAGSHLYGLSPIKAALRNIESSNDAIDHNVKTMKNSGVFGFITSADANAPFTPEQALQIKEKLVEMDKSNGRLSKLAGGSVPVAFTKLSLNTNELQPFEFLRYDQKTLCNVLNWRDELLNNDKSSTYNNEKEAKKSVIIDNIQPDLKLLQDAFNKHFIPRFKGYENCVVEWDISELPEMQEDYKLMLEWMTKAPLTPNEIRTALKYETLEIEGMDIVWVENGKVRIDEVGLTESEINKAWEQL